MNKIRTMLDRAIAEIGEGAEADTATQNLLEAVQNPKRDKS